MRGVSCQRTDPEFQLSSEPVRSPEIGLLLALGVLKGQDLANEYVLPEVLKLSAIIVAKIRQIVVSGIGPEFQTEILLKKYCVFILL
jgi:hypothetical protein